MVCLNPHLRQNYSIFMRNFKQNQYKLSNNHIQFSNRKLLCKFESPSKKSWIHPCFYHLFYFIYMGQPIWDPYGARLHCPYGSHMGAHMGLIWVPYRLQAGYVVSALHVQDVGSVTSWICPPPPPPLWCYTVFRLILQY